MMTKIVLVVIILYANHPSTVYRAIVRTTDDCYAQAAVLAKAPPIDDTVVEYTIGCLFKDPIPDQPL
jgi:hypothetical protein